jgi:hypothetical protein
MAGAVGYAEITRCEAPQDKIRESLIIVIKYKERKRSLMARVQLSASIGQTVFSSRQHRAASRAGFYASERNHD